MQQTIFAILTNKTVRNKRVVEKMLDQRLAAGAPWRGKTVVVPPPAKMNVVS